MQPGREGEGKISTSSSSKTACRQHAHFRKMKFC
jgi:hypothetical protein